MLVPNPTKDSLDVRGKVKPSFPLFQQCTNTLAFVFAFLDGEKSILSVPQNPAGGQRLRCRFPLGVHATWSSVGSHHPPQHGLSANPNAPAGIEARESCRS